MGIAYSTTKEDSSRNSSSPGGRMRKQFVLLNWQEQRKHSDLHCYVGICLNKNYKLHMPSLMAESTVRQLYCMKTLMNKLIDIKLPR